MEEGKCVEKYLRKSVKIFKEMIRTFVRMKERFECFRGWIVYTSYQFHDFFGGKDHKKMDCKSMSCFKDILNTVNERNVSLERS